MLKTTRSIEHACFDSRARTRASRRTCHVTVCLSFNLLFSPSHGRLSCAWQAAHSTRSNFFLLPNRNNSFIQIHTMEAYTFDDATGEQAVHKSSKHHSQLTSPSQRRRCRDCSRPPRRSTPSCVSGVPVDQPTRTHSQWHSNREAGGQASGAAVGEACCRCCRCS